MTTPDPLAEVLDAINVASEQIDAVWHAVEELRDADQVYVTARIRPYFDMWRTRIAHVERQRLANELTALRAERDAAHEECARLRDEVERVRAHKFLAAVMVLPPDPAPRPFALYRHRDVSGVSGAGTVAYGVEFPDGTVALRWVGGNPTSVVFHDRGVESVAAIHGHGGATDIVWLAESSEDAAEYERRQEERIATLTAERDHARAIAVELEQGAVGIDPIPPYVREVPCWTVICDECHGDASEATDYSGFGDRWQDATDFLLTDVGGAEACGVAICPTCASQKVHCQSCGREHWGFWGNCIDCWNQATPAPQQPARVPMDSDRTAEVEG